MALKCHEIASHLRCDVTSLHVEGNKLPYHAAITLPYHAAITVSYIFKVRTHLQGRQQQCQQVE